MLISMNFRQDSNEIHHKVVECFQRGFQNVGVNSLMKRETDVEAADVQGKDMVIVIGKNEKRRKPYLLNRWR